MVDTNKPTEASGLTGLPVLSSGLQRSAWLVQRAHPSGAPPRRHEKLLHWDIPTLNCPMPTVLPLEKMSRADKLRAMEELWTDLARDEDELASPAWHEEVLRESEAAVKAGAARFDHWEEAKKRLRRKTARRA